MGATATVRSVQIEQGEVQYDSDMPMGALEALTGAAKEGELGAIMGALSEFVVAWPFDGDPSDPASWRGLRRTQFNAVVQAVMEDLGDQGNV
jgi:hypothetical protein